MILSKRLKQVLALVLSLTVLTSLAIPVAADADTRFVGGDHRGGERQHGRNIRAVAVAGDRVVRKIGVGHRRAGRGARGGDFDLLEAVHAYRIALLRVGGHCGDARQNG